MSPFTQGAVRFFCAHGVPRRVADVHAQGRLQDVPRAGARVHGGPGHVARPRHLGQDRQRQGAHARRTPAERRAGGRTLNHFDPVFLSYRVLSVGLSRSLSSFVSCCFLLLPSFPHLVTDIFQFSTSVALPIPVNSLRDLEARSGHTIGKRQIWAQTCPELPLIHRGQRLPCAFTRFKVESAKYQ